jgi:DNA-binding response OmpR family regulator
VLSATLPVVSAADVAAVLVRHGEGLRAVVVGVGAGQAEFAGRVLAAGATGVVTRPYRSSEIAPLIRHHIGLARRPPDDVLSVGPLRLDGPAFEVTAAGRTLPLTLREFELLRLLMIHAGMVVPLQRISRQLWGLRGASVRPNTVAVHVRHLRAHLAGTAEIVAVRGLGYRLRVEGTGPGAHGGSPPEEETS